MSMGEVLKQKILETIKEYDYSTELNAEDYWDSLAEKIAVAVTTTMYMDTVIALPYISCVRKAAAAGIVPAMNELKEMEE